MWKILSLWREKTTGQIPNNFTIIKSITIILVYVSRLKKNLSYFSLLSHTHTHTHTHTNYLFQRQWHFTLSSSAIFSILLHSSQAKISFLSLGLTLYFPSTHKDNPWVKAIKFLVALSIYKILLLFPFRLGIHYLFNKESISSWNRNTLSF